MQASTLYTSAAALVLVAVGATWLLALTWEPQQVSPGSISYFLGIPSTVRAVPLFKTCREPRYGYVGAEGTKSSFSTVEYGSRLDRDDVIAAYRSWLEPGGCELREEAGTLFADGCDTPIDLLHADFSAQSTADPGCVTVTITAMGE